MRRGSILDLLLMIIFALVLTMSFYIIYGVYDSWQTSWVQTTNASGSYDTTQQQIVQSGVDLTNFWIDITPYVLLFLGFGSIILAFMIPVHPVFTPLAIFTLAIFIFLSAIFSNVLYDFMTAESMLAITNSHPLLFQFIKFMPHVIAILGAVLIIVMYGQRGMQQTAQGVF